MSSHFHELYLIMRRLFSGARFLFLFSVAEESFFVNGSS